MIVRWRRKVSHIMTITTMRRTPRMTIAAKIPSIFPPYFQNNYIIHLIRNLSRIMPRKYTSEQFWKLYEKLPQELKDALFAEETGNNIYEICQRNKIEENLKEIVEFVGQVLLGILPPEEFQETLEKELKIKKDLAKKVAQEINRFIFYPVKPVLEKLYKMEIKPSEKPVEKPKIEAAPEEEKAPTPPRKDIYREPIE
jgi:hypothetical protein